MPKRTDDDLSSSIDRLRRAVLREFESARQVALEAEVAGDDFALARAWQRLGDARLALSRHSEDRTGTQNERSPQQARLRAAIKVLLRSRGDVKTICPSEAARIVGGGDWRAMMDATRDAAWALVEEQWLEVLQKGETVDRSVRGPVRLRKK